MRKSILVLFLLVSGAYVYALHVKKDDFNNQTIKTKDCFTLGSGYQPDKRLSAMQIVDNKTGKTANLALIADFHFSDWRFLTGNTIFLIDGKRVTISGAETNDVDENADKACHETVFIPVTREFLLSLVEAKKVKVRFEGKSMDEDDKITLMNRMSLRDFLRDTGLFSKEKIAEVSKGRF